jgi:hypothetical protein
MRVAACDINQTKDIHLNEGFGSQNPNGIEP